MSSLQVQEMQYPGYAALYFHLGEIQLSRDIAVIQTFAQQAINRAKDTCLLPEAAQVMPLSRKNRQAEPPFVQVSPRPDRNRQVVLPPAQRNLKERGNIRL